MGETVRGITIAVVSAGLLSLFGYFTVVKTNEVKIGQLSEKISGLQNQVTEETKNIRGDLKETDKVANKTRIFIAQAHPDRQLTKIMALDFLENYSHQQVSNIVKTVSTIPKKQWRVSLANDSDLSKEEIDKFLSTILTKREYNKLAKVPNQTNQRGSK